MVDAHNASLYSARSLAHFFAGDAVASLADADECVRLRGNFFEGHFRRARALNALGASRQVEGAQRSY